jgi:hypothetical protein
MIQWRTSSKGRSKYNFSFFDLAEYCFKKYQDNVVILDTFENLITELDLHNGRMQIYLNTYSLRTTDVSTHYALALMQNYMSATHELDRYLNSNI